MSGITRDIFSAPADGRPIHLDQLLNDFDRDALIEPFGGAALAAVETALSEKNAKPYVHFVVLEPQAVAPEVLLACLRLPPVCELMDLHISASLYPDCRNGSAGAAVPSHRRKRAGTDRGERACRAGLPPARRRAARRRQTRRRTRHRTRHRDSEAAALQHLASFELPANTAP